MNGAASLSIDHSPAAVANPYPLYDRLRRSAPVHHDRQRDVWLVSRHADVMRVLRNPALFSTRVSSFESTLLGADGPRHLHVRRALGRALAGPSAKQFDAGIARAAERLVTNLRDRGGGEAVEEIANALTLTTAAATIGLTAPPSAELRRWPAAILHLGDPWLSAQEVQDLQCLARELRCFVEQHIAQLAGGGAPGDVARLLAGGGAGASLAPQERVDIAMLLLVAGHDTTTSMIGHALTYLIQSPDLRQRLASDASLMDPFIEEVLRLESPVQRVTRVTTARTELANVEIPEGAIVEAILGAANRDDAASASPTISVQGGVGGIISRLASDRIFVSVHGSHACRRASWCSCISIICAIGPASQVQIPIPLISCASRPAFA
jgi:cytochrome P450